EERHAGGEREPEHGEEDDERDGQRERLAATDVRPEDAVQVVLDRGLARDESWRPALGAQRLPELLRPAFGVLEVESRGDVAVEHAVARANRPGVTCWHDP